jgi:hypothetical protein
MFLNQFDQLKVDNLTTPKRTSLRLRTLIMTRSQVSSGHRSMLLTGLLPAVLAPLRSMTILPDRTFT